MAPRDHVDAAQPVWPGSPVPLGATWDGAGTNFAVWSSTATAVTLCLFDRAGYETRVPLATTGLHTWHGYLPDVGPGQRYGLRMDGPTDRSRGVVHDHAKLLVDPYGRAVDGTVTDHPSLYLTDDRDSAPYVPRSIVVRDDFPWGGDQPPRVPWDQLIVYEMHVKGWSALNPAVPAELRGTYAGVAHPASIAYLTGLGVTAVELLPVHAHVTEPAIQHRGLVNYWGYNTLGFFAPDSGYATRGPTHPADAVREFKVMVRELHAAGIEVILDVVYNHTAEGPPDGPVLSFRGIDNANYYRTDPTDRSRYLDYTGCGNTFDARPPHSLQLIMDSLRYWVGEMHVDGFRFDLASALARSLHDVDRLSAFFDTIHQDPVVSRVKLIAEPWDVGAGGYQVGEFPPLWAEWNGKYRDTVRDFWRGQADGVRDLAYRLSGSSDLYGDDGRTPSASINFVTAHDGFTMRDLVSYSRKHNAANLEDNRDGTDDNRSDNHGVEGETDDPTVVAVRRRQVRNLLATLLLSTGAPMLLAGDERWNTQRGNNNTFCQDNATSWLDWTPDPDADALRGFAARLIALRRRHPALRQRAFFDGRPVRIAGLTGRPAPGQTVGPAGVTLVGATPAAHGATDGLTDGITDGITDGVAVTPEVQDLVWFRPDGTPMTGRDWFDGGRRTLGMYLDGRGLRERGPRGEAIVDDSFLLLLHAGTSECRLTLPGAPYADRYRVLVDTRTADGRPAGRPLLAAGDTYRMVSRSLSLLRVIRADAPDHRED